MRVRRTYAPPAVKSRPRERCLIDGCENLEELANGRSAGGLCAAHRKRKQLNPERPDFERPIDHAKGRKLGPRRLLLDAVMAFADAEPDELDAKIYTLFKRIRLYTKAVGRRGSR